MTATWYIVKDKQKHKIAEGLYETGEQLQNDMKAFVAHFKSLGYDGVQVVASIGE